MLLIFPKAGILPYKQDVAETTIEILGLNSKDQAKARMDIYTLTNEAFKNIEAIDNFDDEECIEQLAQLSSYIDDSCNCSYLGMIDSMFGLRLRALANQIDQYLTRPYEEYFLLSDVVESIDRLLDEKGYNG